MFGSNEQVTSVSSVSSVGYLGDTLDKLRKWFGTYIYFQRESDLDVVTLWAFHTWVCQDLYSTPRLLINSAEPGSGKTTLLEHLKELSCRGRVISSLGSPVVLKRLIQIEPRTLLIDEADRNLNPNRPGVQDLIAIINSGYKVGGTAPTAVPVKGGGWVVEEMTTFSPVAIAGNGTHLPNDTLERCITIQLLKDRFQKTQESDWELLDPLVKVLADEVSHAANEYKDLIKSMSPQLPEGCNGRHRERWKPLARIAQAAGGEWWERLQQTITRDLEAVAEMVESGDGFTPAHIQLVKDLHEVFGKETLFVSSNTLIVRLVSLNPGQWGASSYFGKDLTVQRMGNLISRNFRITSGRQGDNIRGYHPSQFEDIWKHLGVKPQKVTEPTEPTEPTTTVHESDPDELF